MPNIYNPSESAGWKRKRSLSHFERGFDELERRIVLARNVVSDKRWIRLFDGKFAKRRLHFDQPFNLKFSICTARLRIATNHGEHFGRERVLYHLAALERILLVRWLETRRLSPVNYRLIVHLCAGNFPKSSEKVGHKLLVEDASTLLVSWKHVGQPHLHVHLLVLNAIRVNSRVQTRNLH